MELIIHASICLIVYVVLAVGFLLMLSLITHH